MLHISSPRKFSCCCGISREFRSVETLENFHSPTAKEIVLLQDKIYLYIFRFSKHILPLHKLWRMSNFYSYFN